MTHERVVPDPEDTIEPGGTYVYEHLRHMGFVRNEINDIVAFSVATSIEPVMLGEFVMRERFKVLMEKSVTLRRLCRTEE